MRTIGVEETTTVCAKLFDGNLRCHRPLRNRLVGNLLSLLHGLAIRSINHVAIRVFLVNGDRLRVNELGRIVRFEVLRYASKNQY